MCIAGDINLDAGKYGSIPSAARDLYESWLDLTSINGLELLPTGPTFKSFGKHKDGRHYISTLDQIYVSESIPAMAYLMPDAATDHFPVIADLQVRGGKRTCSRKGLEIVSKRNLAPDPVAVRAELKELGVNDWPTPPTRGVGRSSY